MDRGKGIMKTRKPRQPVECLDCHVVCTEDNLCRCCIAIRKDSERE